MAAKLVSVANMKGGVGKTTVAVALAHEFARRAPGVNVLLVDLDAQANASFWMCGDVNLTALIEKGKTIDAFLEDSIVFSKNVVLKDYIFQMDGASSQSPISVIPSSPELRIIEREMIVFLSRRKRNLLEVEHVVTELFNDQMKAIVPRFDYIIFDSAPGISALTEAALRSSEMIIVPTVPDFISNLGLEAFCKTVCWSNKDTQAAPRKPWVVANMVKPIPHHQAMLSEMRSEAKTEGGGFHMFQVEIPEAEWIEDGMSANGGGATNLPPRDVSPFARLAEEVLAAIGAR